MEFSVKEYQEYKEQEILNLYESVGWINYVNNADMIGNAYANSLKILGAYAGEKLLGIIRVVGDGYSIIFIQDILVLPEYQHQGLELRYCVKFLKFIRMYIKRRYLRIIPRKQFSFISRQVFKWIPILSVGLL